MNCGYMEISITSRVVDWVRCLLFSPEPILLEEIVGGEREIVGRS